MVTEDGRKELRSKKSGKRGNLKKQTDRKTTSSWEENQRREKERRNVQ